MSPTAVMPPRIKLTRRRIGDTATEMATKEGIEAVTLRKLANQLGVTPMALYKHVASKDELERLIARGILHKALRPISITKSSSWEDIIWKVANDLRKALLEHPAILRGYVGESFFLSQPNLFLQEHFHDAFTRCGLPPEEHRTIARIIGNFIIGSIFIVLNAGTHPFDRTEDVFHDPDTVELLDDSKFPHLVTAVRASAGKDPTNFDTCMTMLIDLVRSRVNK